MICDNCTHSDGEYCICGIVEDGEIKISKIADMINRTLDENGGYIDWSKDKCWAYEKEEDE